MVRRLASADFIGRTTELDRFATAFAAAADHRPSLVLVAGEAGIGKSRLVAEATRGMRASGGLVLEGGSVDLGDTPLPFGPIVEALRSLFRAGAPELLVDVIDTATEEALGQLLPEIATTPAPPPQLSVLRPEWLQARTFEAVSRLLERVAERQPIVLVVEDVHWADRSTRDLLAFLVHNLHDERLLLVATVRSDELHRRHPVLPWLAELTRHGRVERLDLERFDRDEQGAQLRSILGHPPPSDLLDAVHVRSDGNPFFAEELVAATHSHTDTRPRLPSALADVLLTRLATLSPSAQRMLGAAAVAGRRVDHDLLVAVTGANEAEVEDAVREALSRQFVVAVDDPVAGYEFRHALTREAVYDDLLPSERRRLHARYAAVLAPSQDASGPDAVFHVSEVAHHYVHAQMHPEALAASIAAARAAARTFAFAEAAAHYVRALKLWDVVDVSERPQDIDDVEICDKGAIALSVIGEIRRAVALAREAVRRLDPGMDVDREADLRAHLARLEWQAGDLTAALAAAEEALALVGGAPPSAQGAAVLATVSSLYSLGGELRRAVSVATAGIEMAIAVGARQVEGHAKNTKGTALATLGDCPGGIALLEEALSIAHEFGHPEDMGRGYANLSVALSACGDDARALEMSMAGAEVARRFGMRSLEVVHQSNRAAQLLASGSWDEASAVLEEIEPRVPPGATRMIYRQVAGALAARRGDPDARRYADQTLEELGQMTDAQFVGSAFLAKIEAELYSGRPDAAAAAAREGLRRVADRDDPAFVVRLLALGTAAEAETAQIALARGDNGAFEVAKAAADEYGHRLGLLAAQGLANTGDRSYYVQWAAAERSRIEGPPHPAIWADVRARWTEANQPFPAAYSAFREAEASLEARRPKSEAAAALRDARAIADRLGARPLLGWIDALAGRARITTSAPDESRPTRSAAQDDPLAGYALTRREREILALLARGLTNREIATALFISESTASVHVSNVIGKLGVTNRVQAASLASRLDAGHEST